MLLLNVFLSMINISVSSIANALAFLGLSSITPHSPKYCPSDKTTSSSSSIREIYLPCPGKE
jgi:hypothetical protein